MFDYILHFYNSYLLLFYILLLVIVIIEGPITILALSLVAHKLGMCFYQILIFAFLGDFLGDLIYFFIGRIFKKYFERKNFSSIKKIDCRLTKHKLIDKLIVFKYTPPLTAIGLIYMGISKKTITKFIKNDIILCIFSSILVTSIGYNFGSLFINKNSFSYFIIGLFISFVIFYFLFKIFTNFLIKKIYE